MLVELKRDVYEANLKLVSAGLVFDTWGNVSGADRDRGHFVIKPSGVPYEDMTAEQMVVVSLETGEVAEGHFKPSSDTPTHLEVYRGFPGIGSVAHTHSLFAAAWAQARRDIPAFGTTHADYFHGAVPCTRVMTDDEIRNDYEANTGKVIVERFEGLDPRQLPGVLVADHGPFAWGDTPDQAVHHAGIIEHLARLASETIRIEAYPRNIQQALLDKHFLRKHGPDAYYGQD